MARRLGHKIDIVDANKVGRRYNEAWRKHVKFPTTGSEWESESRLSDYDLWNSGQPTINQGGTIGDGYTELKFIFKGVTEEYADRWVRDFMTKNKLPFTFIHVEPAREDLVSRMTGAQQSLEYVRVIVRFEIDEVINSRTRQLRP